MTLIDPDTIPAPVPDRIYNFSIRKSTIKWIIGLVLTSLGMSGGALYQTSQVEQTVTDTQSSVLNRVDNVEERAKTAAQKASAVERRTFKGESVDDMQTRKINEIIDDIKVIKKAVAATSPVPAIQRKRVRESKVTKLPAPVEDTADTAEKEDVK